MAISTAVDASAVARVVGIKTEFKDLRGGNIRLLPQRIAVVGQGSTAVTYASTKLQVTSAQQAGTEFGFGSPIHAAVKQLMPVNGDGVGTIPVTVYPLQDDGSGVASAGDITPTVAATAAASYRVNISNVLSEPFVVSVGDSVADVVTAMTAAINAVLDMPVIATDSTTQVDLASKWKGTSANEMTISVDGPTDLGVTFAFTQMAGGLVNPDVQDGLDLIGEVWETMVVNCLEVADATALNTYQTFGDGRWGALTKKPLVVFSSSTISSATSAIVIPDARKTDRVNVQLVEPGGVDLPYVITARQVARIAKRANENPPFDYGSLDATGLTPGADSVQWDYTERDVAVKGGSSTIEVKDGVVNLSDTVTMYHPDGEEPPAYRYVVDIVKLQNIIFNLDLIFATDEWNGAPLIPDDQPTSNPAARKPKAAKAVIASMLDSLGLEAIISDPETAKDSIQADISLANPKRLDVSVTVQLSGNTNIISIDLDFGFFFGSPTIIA